MCDDEQRCAEALWGGGKGRAPCSGSAGCTLQVCAPLGASRQLFKEIAISVSLTTAIRHLSHVQAQLEPI